MKKRLKEFTLVITCFFILIFILINNQLVTQNIISAIDLWMRRIFPSLFPMFILNELLIVANFPTILLKLFKKKGLKYYTFIMSLLSGSPSGAYLVKNLLENNLIDSKTGNNYLIFTYFASPIFLYTMLFYLFNNKTIVLKIIFIHYLSNFLISLFIKNKTTSKYNLTLTKLSLPNIISKSIDTLLMILGTITFYAIIITLISNIFPLSELTNSFLKGLLELTQGLNSLSNLNINQSLKEALAIVYISFGGLSIHTQIKSIISDTSLEYKYFFLGRIIQTVISLLLWTFSNSWMI